MNNLFLSALLFLSISCIAQQEKLSFKIGDEYKVNLIRTDVGFVGNQKNGILNLAYDDDNLYITRFDPITLKRTSDKTVPLKGATKNFASDQVYGMHNEKYYWLNSDWDPESKTEYLYYDKFDIAGGNVDIAHQQINKSSKLKSTGSFFVSRTGHFVVSGKYQTYFNSNKTKMLVKYMLLPEARNNSKNYDIIGMHVFDEDMNKQWGGEFKMPYTEASMDYIEFLVDSVGNAYLLTQIKQSEEEKAKDDNRAYRFELLKFSAGKSTPDIIPFKMHDIRIRTIYLLQTEDNNIMVGGTTDNPGTYTNGVFLGILDKTANAFLPYKTGSYPFPISEAEKFASKKELRKAKEDGDFDLEFFNLKNIVIEKSGAALITGELNQRKTTSSTGNGMYSVYYANDIYAIRIDEQGKLDWMRKIPKKQINADNYGAMGQVLVPGKNAYHFVYCDNKKNLDIKPDEEPELMKKFGRNSYVVASSISKKNGIQQKQLLFDTKQEDLTIIPTEIRPLDEKSYIGRAVIDAKSFRPFLLNVSE